MTRRTWSHHKRSQLRALGPMPSEHGHHKRARHSAIFHGRTLMSGEHGHSNKGQHHEAHLIPGVDGHRTYGFPNSIITKLRYVENLTISGSAGAVGYKIFAANGLYDPNISDTGHQPMYYDNYTSIYDQYVVLGSKITVHIMNSGTVDVLMFGIVGDDDSTISTNTDTLMEQNNSVYTLSGTVNSEPKVLTMTFEPLRDFGVDAKDDGASSTGIGANPAEMWCYGVWAAAANGSSSIACNFIVEIEYTAKFTELKTPTQN